MRNPCGKACPDRTPGCCCEKRQAWLFCLKQEKEARERVKVLEGFQADSSRQNRKTTVRRRHRI